MTYQLTGRDPKLMEIIKLANKNFKISIISITSHVVLVVKNLPTNAGDMSLISRWERSPGGGNGNTLLYSCLGNPMDRGTWRTTVHRVTKSWTWLSTHTHYKYIHDLEENMDTRVRNRNFNNGYNKRLHATEKMVSKLKHGRETILLKSIEKKSLKNRIEPQWLVRK